MPKIVPWTLCLLLVSAAACGPKTIALPPVVSSPRFPEFVAPRVAAVFAHTPAASQEDRGWAFLQAGDLKSAERELVAALKASPDFFAAETALGYLELARKDAKAALAHFDRTLKKEQSDPSALVGSGQAKLLLNRESEALVAFEAAIAADPSLVDIKQRVEVLQFRGLEQQLTKARAAAREQRFDEAIRTYAAAIARSPDSPFLYRELAGVERQTGEAEAAIEHLRKAVALDANDVSSLEQIGDLLDARGDLEGAAKLYAAAVAIEPRPDLAAKLDTARARAELARLPADYRAIDDEPQVTRGDLAALIGVRLAQLLRVAPGRTALPITDLRTHWATTWIMMVVRAGIMDPFANHAFQPRMVVRRIDLAQAVGRLLERVAAQKPTGARAWETARLQFNDLAAGHLAYQAASAAVASGVLTVGADQRFQPARPVSGREAIQAVNRISALAGILPPTGMAQ